MPKLLVHKTEHFSIEHAHFCHVPGYLIIEPVTPVADISRLSEGAQREIGLLQARCVRAIQSLLSPLRIYCLTFAEELPRYHCHIFPRSQEATTLYLQQFPAQGLMIRGSQFFDWAREKYRKDVSGDSVILELIPRIRQALGGN